VRPPLLVCNRCQFISTQQPRETVKNTRSEALQEAAHPYAQRVRPKPVLPTEFLPVFDLCSSLPLIIPQYERALVAREQLLHAVLQATILTFGLVCVRSGWRRRGEGFGPQVLTSDIARNSIKIKRRIVFPIGRHFAHVLLYSSERFVRQILRFPTTTTCKNLDQLAANLFVTPARVFAVCIEPRKQMLERFRRRCRGFIRHCKTADLRSARAERHRYAPQVNKGYQTALKAINTFKEVRI